MLLEVGGQCFNYKVKPPGKSKNGEGGRVDCGGVIATRTDKVQTTHSFAKVKPGKYWQS